MARPRLELQTILERIVGGRNVYFQPPQTIRMQYPCIVYNLSQSSDTYADNFKYKKLRRYSVTVIDRNPESSIVEGVEALDYCTLNTTFASDNLNHFVFELYF